MLSKPNRPGVSMLCPLLRSISSLADRMRNSAQFTGHVRLRTVALPNVALPSVGLGGRTVLAKISSVYVGFGIAFILVLRFPRDYGLRPT